MAKYHPQFTRTLDAQVPAIYPHPRCFYPQFTRILVFFYPQFTRTLVCFLPAIYPHPRFFLPAIYPHPRFFFTRNLPAPVAPAARRYPATRETLRPCIPATSAPRVPVGAPCPWHPPQGGTRNPPQYPHPCVFVPVAPATRRYPATRETLRPCIPATRAPRVPVGAPCPWHPPQPQEGTRNPPQYPHP